MKFLAEHPILFGVGVLLGVGFVGAYWQVFVFVCLAGAAGYGLWRGGVALDNRSRGQIRRRQALAANADYEHHLLLNGHPGGTYGRFPPRI